MVLPLLHNVYRMNMHIGKSPLHNACSIIIIIVVSLAKPDPSEALRHSCLGLASPDYNNNIIVVCEVARNTVHLPKSLTAKRSTPLSLSDIVQI